MCATCQERKARFRYRGEVRADRDHTICFECYRGEINRARVRRMNDGTALPRLPFGHHESVDAGILDQRQIAHLQRMLDHLQRPCAVAP